MGSDNHKQLSGIVTPLITPFSSKGKIDFAALETLANHVIEGGVSGLLLLGTTGEGPCLTQADRYKVIEQTTRFVSGRVPVLVCVSDAAFDNSVQLARYSNEAGADALVMTPPPYFSATQEELLGYFEALSSISELPCYLYNFPALAKVSIDPATVVLASELPRIAGLKDSSGDMEYFRAVKALMRDNEGFTLFMGPEERMSSAVMQGANGGVNGGSNLFPQLYVLLCDAAVKQDHQRVAELQEIVAAIGAQLYSLSKFENHCVRVVKYLLSLFGVCGDAMAEPYLGLSAENKRVARARLEDILLKLKKSGVPTGSLSIT